MTIAERPLERVATSDRAEVALDRAVQHLLSLQADAGWWKGELETNVTMDAEDLLLREFLGIRGDQETEEAARWIRSQQRDDGTWANFFGGPADLSTTVEAWIALRLAGDAVDAPHMRQATTWICANGGVESTRVFTRIWLALFGLWSWDELPNLPPEIVFLPKWFPFNLYDWTRSERARRLPVACRWARGAGSSNGSTRCCTPTRGTRSGRCVRLQ